MRSAHKAQSICCCNAPTRLQIPACAQAGDPWNSDGDRLVEKATRAPRPNRESLSLPSTFRLRHPDSRCGPTRSCYVFGGHCPKGSSCLCNEKTCRGNVLCVVASELHCRSEELRHIIAAVWRRWQEFCSAAARPERTGVRMWGAICTSVQQSFSKQSHSLVIPEPRQSHNCLSATRTG